MRRITLKTLAEFINLGLILLFIISFTSTVNAQYGGSVLGISTFRNGEKGFNVDVNKNDIINVKNEGSLCQSFENMKITFQKQASGKILISKIDSKLINGKLDDTVSCNINWEKLYPAVHKVIITVKVPQDWLKGKDKSNLSLVIFKDLKDINNYSTVDLNYIETVTKNNKSFYIFEADISNVQQTLAPNFTYTIRAKEQNTKNNTALQNNTKKVIYKVGIGVSIITLVLFLMYKKKHA